MHKYTVAGKVRALVLRRKFEVTRGGGGGWSVLCSTDARQAMCQSVVNMVGSFKESAQTFRGVKSMGKQRSLIQSHFLLPKRLHVE